MINIQGIDHVQLWVSSIDETGLYFKNIFGFSCKPRAQDIKTLVVESESVHLFISETDQDFEFSKQHLSFKVSSLDDVISHLEKNSIQNYSTGKVDCFDHNNYRWCEWRGPDNIRLECVEYSD